ncbi:unnamed protein product [Prorocentrum cordatum]|uniref:Uncharacterized protein n=1 Tax=Prorocentrum cordatum TaxID=2364126 RepID=A0ABN9WZR4_9DINO|nr:unnamed protein product [Polarella glacialis]
MFGAAASRRARGHALPGALPQPRHPSPCRLELAAGARRPPPGAPAQPAPARPAAAAQGQARQARSLSRPPAADPQQHQGADQSLAGALAPERPAAAEPEGARNAYGPWAPPASAIAFVELLRRVRALGRGRPAAAAFGGSLEGCLLKHLEGAMGVQRGGPTLLATRAVTGPVHAEHMLEVNRSMEFAGGRGRDVRDIDDSRFAALSPSPSRSTSWRRGVSGLADAGGMAAILLGVELAECQAVVENLASSPRLVQVAPWPLAEARGPGHLV